MEPQAFSARELQEAGSAGEIPSWIKHAASQNWAPPEKTGESSPGSVISATPPDQVERVSQTNDAYIKEATRLYYQGNLEGSFAYFMKAAQGGDHRAQLQVGFCYEKGMGVNQDYAKSAQWYLASAQNGNAQAMKNIGSFYENGTGINENWIEAAKWYQKGAEAGNADAQEALARAYQFGVGVAQDRSMAIAWDRRAAAQGNQNARYWLNWLSNPMNNSRFRNDYEQEILMSGNRLRTSAYMMGLDPAGLRFANSQERIAWLKDLRARVDADENEQAISQNQQQFKRRNGENPFVIPNPFGLKKKEQ